VALNTFNLPTPTIGATASTQAGDYFNPVLYTGTGSAQSVTGVGFQPDFVWIKRRDAVGNHQLIDSNRGAGYTLQSDNTGSEDYFPTLLASFNTDGFTTTATNGATYVAWNWRANQGTNVTNTAGSITSTVSANTSAGFSVVTYTGAGTGFGASVGHGLGVKPIFVIYKRRDASSDWVVRQDISGSMQYAYLNQTTAFDAGGATAPTSSVLYLDSYLNASGGTYVAYAFADVAGYSKFGSYAGNGSTNGTFVYTGFRPKYVMAKRTNGADVWLVLDAARDPYNVANKFLQAQSSDAEGTVSSLFDFVSNGFKLRTSTNPNDSGATYIYMAFAETPFNYANAR
jgi:hypothetical protein